ncbi:MAG TPA: hypothetical protein VIT43_08365 [Candidatus Dormibacteraeota bacterium]
MYREKPGWRTYQRPLILVLGWGGLGSIAGGLAIALVVTANRRDVVNLWGVIIAFATFLLAVLASGFAVLAYAIASSKPKLIPQIQVPGCPPNSVIFRKGAPDGRKGIPLLSLDGNPTTVAKFTVFNKSDVSASNVMCRIDFRDLTLPYEFHTQDWICAVLSDAQDATTGIQHSNKDLIHGRVRWVPEGIDLRGLRLSGNDPAIDFLIAADGYHWGGRLRVEVRE